MILPEVENPADTQQMVRPRYEYEYDAQGNRTVIRDNVVQIGSTVYYDHDGIAGNDVRETLFTYDDFGNQLTRELPMGQTESFEYDEETLRLILHTDFEGNITESVYSDFGFLDELRYYAPGSDPDIDSPDETVDYSYNSLDQRSQISDARGDTDYTYDEYDRLAQIDTPEGTLNYEYDNYGRQSRKYVGDPPPFLTRSMNRLSFVIPLPLSLPQNEASCLPQSRDDFRAGGVNRWGDPSE